MLKAIHVQEDHKATEQNARFVVEKLWLVKLLKAVGVIADVVSETISDYTFPRVRWRQLRINNPLERIMREIR